MIEANSQDKAEKISVSCQALTLNAGYVLNKGDGHVLILLDGADANAPAPIGPACANDASSRGRTSS